MTDILLTTQSSSSSASLSSSSSSRSINVTAAAIAAVTSLSMGALVHHALYQGQAQSFDALIHARSLWGLAYGAPVNPVLGVHALSVHGYFLSVLLIPFARVLPSTTVLVAAQTLALFLTVFLTAKRAGVIIAETGSRAPTTTRGAPMIGALLGGLLVTFGSPLVVNPFFFDARPELLGLPIAVWALLRIESRGGFDARAVIGLLLSMLGREEFAMVVIGAVVLFPEPKRDLRLRAIALIAALGWWGSYAFMLRRWIGGDVALARLASTPATLVGSLEDASLFFKGEIVIVCVLAMGGLALVGWRWAGAAVPGLLFLLVQNRLGSLVLNFHYGMFAAPGLIVAGIAGLRKVTTRSTRGAAHAQTSEAANDDDNDTQKARRKSLAILATVTTAIGALLFVLSSAAPGGRRHRRMFFTQTTETRDARSIIERVPAQRGLAAPYAFAASFADRPMVMHEGALLATHGAGTSTTSTPTPTPTTIDIPNELDYLALPASSWPTIGRFAVEQRGFKLVDLKPGVMALLVRGSSLDPNQQRASQPPAPQPAPDVSSLARAPTCSAPIARWTDLGLTLCSVGRYTDTRALLIVMRESAPIKAGGPVVFLGQTTFGILSFVGYEGVFNAEQLPIGKAMRLLTRAPLASFPMTLRAGQIDDEIGAMTSFDAVMPAAEPPPSKH